MHIFPPSSFPLHQSDAAEEPRGLWSKVKQASGLWPLPEQGWPLTPRAKEDVREVISEALGLLSSSSSALYWLPKCSIMQWFTRSVANASQRLTLHQPIPRVIYQRMEAGPGPCLLTANRRARKQVWIQDVKKNRPQVPSGGESLI